MREADRLLQRLARRCLHCLAFAVLLLRIDCMLAIETHQAAVYSLSLTHCSLQHLVVCCAPRCLCLASSHPQRALPALHQDDTRETPSILHHLAAPVTPPASPFSLACYQQAFHHPPHHCHGWPSGHLAENTAFASVARPPHLIFDTIHYYRCINRWTLQPSTTPQETSLSLPPAARAALAHRHGSKQFSTATQARSTSHSHQLGQRRPSTRPAG
jgi:hypothetical protein